MVEDDLAVQVFDAGHLLRILNREELLSLRQRFDQRVYVGFVVVHVERGSRRRRNAELTHQRFRTMVAGSYAHGVLVEDLAHVVRMDPVEQERHRPASTVEVGRTVDREALAKAIAERLQRGDLLGSIHERNAGQFAFGFTRIIAERAAAIVEALEGPTALAAFKAQFAQFPTGVPGLQQTADLLGKFFEARAIFRDALVTLRGDTIPDFTVALRQLTAQFVEAREKAGALLRRLNIPARLWALPPSTFSGGEQQRVNIARGFISDLPILLLDEPTASLDAANRAVVVELIDQKKRQGVAMVAIVHDDEIRQEIADRIVDVTSFAAAFKPSAATA